MVENKPLAQELLAQFQNALRSLTPSQTLEPSLREQMALRGVLLTLQEDGSKGAVELLIQAALSCPIPDGNEYAFKALQSLALAGNQDAIDGLFQLAVDHDHLEAQICLLENQLESSNPEQTAVLHLLSGEMDGKHIDLDQLNLLAKAFFSSTESIRGKMLSVAGRSGLKNWADIVAAFSSPSQESLTPIISGYSALQPAERRLFRGLLFERAKAGLQVCSDEFCELFIQYDVEEVRRLAVQHRLFPQGPIQRALFLFLAGEWEDYTQHDFDQSLITAAYEMGTPEVRKRILTTSRESGFTGWLKDLHTGISSGARLLADLTAQDWQTTLQALQEKDQWEQIWRLALAAPPIRGAKIIRTLAKSAWTPEKPETQEFLHRLENLAEQCLKHPIELVPTHTLPTGLAVLNLAASLDSSVLAAGTRGGEIHLWRNPLFTPLGTLQLGAVQGVRALSIDNQGRYLAAACGDKSIRILEMDTRKLIKTLTGHQNLVRSLVIHPDERTLISGSFDGTVRIWRFPLGPEQQCLAPGQGEIQDIAVSPDGEFLLSAGFDQGLTVYRLPDASLVRKLAENHSTINRLAISPRSPYVAAYEANGEIKIWNYESGRQLAGITLPNPDNALTNMVVHPSENLLLTGDTSGDLRFWQTTSGESLNWVKIEGNLQRVTGILFLENGRQLVTADAAGILKVFALDTLLLAGQPIELHNPALLKTVEEKLQAVRSNASEKIWLSFVGELLRWRQRFDVELSAQTLITGGEFDIQL